jgi:tetratricopeptide (TPR) repeat protein
MRESKAAEEEDGVVKNRRHLKQHGVLGKGAARDVSEEDATWLKAKGDDFFRGGDARSAVSAYSAAIDADASMTSCFSNRSACYLKLGQFADCRADCSSAIDQLDATASLQQKQHNSSQEASARAQLHKLLLRRAVSSCHLGDFAAAIADQSRVLAAVEALHSVGLDSGLGAATTPVTVMADLKMLRLLADADALKKQGDAVFAERRVDEAKGCYDQALSLVPLHVGCLSNRSACKLALGDVQGCVDDCSHALELLQLDPAASSSSSSSSTQGQGLGLGLNMLAAVLPPAGSDKRLAWVTRTVARRVQALAQLNRLPEAAEDFRRAAALNPANEALKDDLVKIEAALKVKVSE